MKKYLLIAAIICLGSWQATVYSQEEKISENTKNVDSLAAEIKKAFYAGNYALIIRKTPAAVALAQEENNLEKEYEIKSKLGNTFIKLNDTLGARKVFKSLIPVAAATNDYYYTSAIYIDLGNTYVNSDPEIAISYFSKVLPLEEKVKSPSHLFIAHYNLAELYLNQNRLSKAKPHIDKAFALNAEIKKEVFQTGCHLVRGRYLLLNYKVPEAIIHFEKGAQIAAQVNFKEFLLDNYKYHLLALEQLEDYEGMYNLRKLYEPVREDIYKGTKISELQAAQAQYNISQYEQTIKTKDLEKQLAERKANESKMVSIFAVGAMLLLFVALLAFSRSLKKRKKLLVSLKDKNRKYLLAKEKSDQLAASKVKFFSTVSHELRTPLYGIIGLSSSLLKENKEAKLEQDIKSLKFSADYLLALVNDVLHLNKLEKLEGRKLEKKTFNLQKLTKNIVNSFEFMLEQNNNKIQITIDPSIPQYLIGDATKLSQILMNILGNACKFTEEGTIDVKVKKQKVSKKVASLRFEISDTGIGIPKEKQKQIFDEFTQVGVNTKYQGTGLGLSIVNKILELHDSKLEFKSELNKGSSFWFTIRYELSNQEQEGNKTVLTDHHNLLHGKHILIVDDNRINQIVSQKIIENNEMTSDTASNGLEAIECIKQKKYDIILMDLNMPEMNGFEASTAIRKMGIGTPIIALTAVNKEENNNKLDLHGINDIIVKPYEIDHFKKVLSHNLLDIVTATSTS